MAQKMQDFPHGLCQTDITGLRVRLGGSEILDGIDLSLTCGGMTAVIGPNGGGKSTLFKALLGLVRYTGTIAFRSHDGQRRPMPSIGYVPQQLDLDRLAPVSVLDLCAACLQSRPVFLPLGRGIRQRITLCLEETGAADLINRRVGALSGGELQRVLLALALVPQPEMLLLDEPVSAVDAAGMRVFYETVGALCARRDLTVVLVSHDFDAVSRHAQRAVLLNRTVLDDGPPKEVLSGAPFAAQFGFRWSGEGEK